MTLSEDVLYKKFTCQLTLRRPPLTEVWCSLTEHPESSEKAFPPFSGHRLCGRVFQFKRFGSSSTSRHVPADAQTNPSGSCDADVNAPARCEAEPLTRAAHTGKCSHFP